MGSSSTKSAPPPIPTLETQQVEELKISTVVGIEATAITMETATPTTTAMPQDWTLGLEPTTEPTIAQSAPFYPFVRTQQLIVGNWIRKKTKDLIIGLVCSNDTCQG